MHRSVSEPSLGTIGNITITTHDVNIPTNLKATSYAFKGQWFWKGRRANLTRLIVLAPWSIWWQTLVILSVIFKYVCHFLLAYYLDSSWDYLDIIIILGEAIFVCDLFIHMLHTFWPILRFHIRIYRRSYTFMIYDTITLIPFTIVFKYQKSYKEFLLLGRWLGIIRIYRIFGYFQLLNIMMRTSRMKLYVLEHLITIVLILHGSTCLWFNFNKSPVTDMKKWYSLGYPSHVNLQKLQFDNYTSCWYYCACRLFNVIFGDAFPLNCIEKWLTSFLMLTGFVLARYRFIGILAWELILQDERWAGFVEQYHHMIEYLKFRGAPTALVEEARKYKEHLWAMKDGVLTSEHLQELPLPLQMELIFDINVGHFHDTLLFKDASEAFMRHTSLLMKHELFLQGQPIWNQGVVKSGMICVKQGVLEMLSDEDDESPVIAFKQGTVLGEISLFYSIPAKVTVKAASYVELQVLRRTDFMRAMVENPSMLQQIRKKVEMRLKNSKTRKEAIVKYDSNDSRLLRTRYRPMKVLKDYLAGVEEEDPKFVDDSHMYYKDENNIRQRKFTRDYLDLYHISPNVTTVKAPRVCLRSNFPWILEPDTSFTYMFDVIHFMTVIYVCIITPHIAIESVKSDWETVLDIIIMTLLLLNIYIQLTTAIVDKNIRKETVREIAEVKMASLGFYLDIISVSPVHIFSDTLDPDRKTFGSQLIVMVPVIQVWHIWDYFNKWERNFHSYFKFLCIMKFSLIFVIFCYWFGCFLYIYACPRKLCQENSWMAQLIYWETKVFVTNDAMHERPLLSSLYFGTSVFTGTGMSDLAPGSGDLTLVVFLFTLGMYLSCFYMAKVCCLYLFSTRRKLKFKESMRELFYFLNVNHVSGRIKARVKNFFCVQWYYNRVVSTEEIFKDMSANIQQEVLSIEMIETLLLSPLFQECSRDFLQTVAANTRTIVLPDNEIVQHAADIGRDMYIVQKGYCNKLNQNGKIVGSIASGSHFGDFEMLYGLPKVYTVVTSTNCVLLHVEYSALVQCWSTFPDISHPIIATLRDPEIRQQASSYEDANPLSGRINAKTNRIAQEIKESFVILSGRDKRSQYLRAFDKLGFLRYIRYLFLPGCITPHGIFLKHWCALRLVTAMYYILIVPYNIATKQHKYSSGYHWLDTVLFIDLVIMCYVAYYNERSLLVTHPLLTLSRYLKRGFLLDVISVFPFEEMVTRITGAFNYWESNIMQTNQAVVLLKFIPFAVTFVNFVTALIFMKSCRSYARPDSYYVLVNCTRVLVLNSNKFEIKYAVSEYVRTFYWVFEIFVGCGCTPVILSYTINVWLAISLQMAGVLYFAFMFGYVASTRSATAHALLEHNEKTKDLANFLYHENVDPVLTVKTLKYFEYIWKRTNGSNPQQICRGLNSALMEDTLVFMYEKALREVPLFEKVERSFIRVITQHLHEMYFLKGDTVVQCKDVQTNVYIIYRGKVDVLSSYNEMITCMGPGGMFGNFTGQAVSCSQVSIYASRSLDLLVLPCQTFLNLVKFYPKIQEPLYKAFEISKDYILPISMETAMDDEFSEDSDLDILSQDSAFESRSGSLRYEIPGQISLRSSQSNVSSAKSSASVLTYQSMTIANLFRPGSRIYQGFGYFTCFLATASYVLTLYEMVTLNDCVIFFWLQSFLDMFFYLKTYQTMHQGYINRHGELIMASGKCRRRYFKHRLWFWSDLLVGIPLELFGFCFPKPQTAMHYLRANKLFRLKYLVEFYRKTSAALTNNLIILQTVMVVFVMVLFIHTFTCIWLLTLIAISPFSIIRTLKMHLIDEDTPQRRWDYTTSFYIVVSELTSTGGDEFVVDEVFSMVIMAICLICGKMLAAIILATSIQVAYSSKYALTTYETATKKLIDVLKNQGLSNYQLEKFWKYVQQLWLTERGRQLPELLRKTPYVLRCDLMSSMFGHHLRNCFLFADTGEPFLRQLTVLLDYTIYFPGNYIVVAGDSDARMHWVASGMVSVVSVRSDLTETTHEMLGTGDVFGILQGLNRGVQHCFSYRAETKATILSLNLDSWSNILLFFPEAKNIISERAEFLFTQI